MSLSPASTHRPGAAAALGAALGAGLRVGVVSATLPSAQSGQGNVLRLLIEQAGFDLCLFFSETSAPENAQAIRQFAGRFERLPPPKRTLAARARKKFGKLRAKLSGQPKPSGRLQSAPEIARAHARQIAAGVESGGVEVLVACSGSLTDIPSTTLAAEKTGARLALYIFDDYVNQWRVEPERDFALDWERRAMARASAVIVPNELLADVYRRRHGVEPTIVRNPRAPEYDARLAAAAAQADPLEIVYTGSVYDAQIDSIERVIAAMRSIGQGHRLTIYTAVPPSAAPGIARAPEVDWRGYVENEASIDAQLGAGALLLPLSFGETVAEVVRTAAPGKLGEYLASGRPILAHAPGDCFVIELLRGHDCAMIAEEPTVDAVATALRAIASGGDEVARRVAKARTLAGEFALPQATEAFVKALRE